LRGRRPIADDRTVSILLTVRDLSIAFDTARGTLAAVEGASLTIAPGEILGLVGESGSGKSATALAILRLLGAGGGRVTAGSIGFAGRDLLALDEEAMRRVRGAEIAMIFQEPMTSLNPLRTIGAQIAEPLLAHGLTDRREAERRMLAMLARVGIPDPPARARAYPHELSGGMRQRAMIAMALICGPKLLIADEPTTALDVTIQAQILELIADLRRELDMAVLLITHDLGIVAEFADRAAVMYAGRIVETAPVNALFAAPLHPYTRGLLRSMPDVEDDVAQLSAIAGSVPQLGAMPRGCRFHPRCAEAHAPCGESAPAQRAIEGREVACFLHR
jgi:oligopeptide/dipeptide ABC transporter ATP-binding protein